MPIPLLKDTFEYYPPICAWVSQVVALTQVSPPKSGTRLSFHHTCYVPRLSYYSWFDYTKNILWWVQVMKFLLMQCSPLSCCLVPLRHKYPSQHPILEHPQSLFSLSVKDQVSHPYKTTGKIILLYTLIFVFLDSNLEERRFCTEW
jgi:hypothetical protein